MVFFSKGFILFSSADDKVYHGGQKPLNLNESLLITLTYLANQGAIRIIAEKFGRSQFAVWTAVDSICDSIFENYKQVIKWPEVDSLSNIASKFKERAGFPGVIGCIDGCHIPINAPVKCQKYYLNYK